MKKHLLVITGILFGADGQLGWAAPKAEDVPPLIKKLADANAKARADAARQLGEIAEVKASYVKEAIPGLLEAVKDKDTAVRREAAGALGKVNADPEKAVPLLIEALKDPDESVQRAAVHSLDFMGPQAKDALGELQRIRKEISKLDREEQKKKQRLRQAIDGALDSIQGKMRKK